MVKESVDQIVRKNKVDLKVFALHPQMVDANSLPDFSKRAPHPGLLIIFD